MSAFLVKGKGWRYDFTHQGTRHTKAWFKTKKEAIAAEAKRKEGLNNPEIVQNTRLEKTQTDTVFLDLVNLRLDYLKDYRTPKYYNDTLYMAKRWIKLWGSTLCNEITEEMITGFLRKRKRISKSAANADITALRALFNHGKRKKLIDTNPMASIEFFPFEKKVKHVPSLQDIDAVIDVAEPKDQDYLWAIRETMGRISEVNRLTWNDVDFEARHVILYTRKKRGGHLTPRKVPMSKKLYGVLNRLHSQRDQDKPWVFWHRYYSRKNKQFVEGPYQDRKRLMKKLCQKAGVRYFRFHPLRHSGASTMESNNVPIGAIQRILGHENRSTTEIYLHSIGNEERDAIDVYERVREKSHTESHTE